MSLNNATENAAISGTDGGKSTANLVYILYILGFFTGISAIVGYVLAKIHTDRSSEPFKSHLVFQRRLFVKGLWLTAISAICWFIVTIIGTVTLGFGFVLYVIPIGVTIWFLVSMIMGIVKGMSSLGRHEAV
jgi:uncharacterized membrane protein